MIGPHTEPEADYELMATLREWRHRRAREEGVPPYVVLPNRLLAEIARLRPASVDELGPIKGMGPGRLNRYGNEILGMVSGSDSTETARPDVCLSTPILPRDVIRTRTQADAETNSSVPYRVIIEYNLDDGARRRLVDELDNVDGSLLRNLHAALCIGPAHVSIRIEAEREAAG